MSPVCKSCYQSVLEQLHRPWCSSVMCSCQNSCTRGRKTWENHSLSHWQLASFSSMNRCTRETLLCCRTIHWNKSIASTTWYPATVLIFVVVHVLAQKNINVHLSTRFDQIHQLFNKIHVLSINIILKSIKGHNSVKKVRKIMCISHNIDHMYQCINKILLKSIHFFLKILGKIEILTSIKDHNSVKKFGKISCTSHNTDYTKFHQNPSICSQDIKWKQNSDINQGT